MIRQAIVDLLRNYEPEDSAIHIRPDPGCLECTAGATPNNRNMGLCAFHKLSRYAVFAQIDGKPKPQPNSNTGHGHVWKRPDGMKARCGGPGMCAECSRDKAALTAAPQPEADESPRSRALSWASKAGATPPEEAAAIYKTYREMKDATAPPGFGLVPEIEDQAEKAKNAVRHLRQIYMQAPEGNSWSVDYKGAKITINYQGLELLLAWLQNAAAPSPPHEDEIEGLDEAISLVEEDFNNWETELEERYSLAWRKILEAARRYAAQRKRP